MALALRMMRVLVAFAVVLAIAQPVAAALKRPNALDRRIDAIPAVRLMHAPATALVDPDRQQAAARYIAWMAPAWIGMIVFQVLVLAYYWQSGTAAHVREFLRARVQPVLLLRFLFGAALWGLAKLAALPFEFYLYRVDRAMGLSTQLTPSWLGDWIYGVIIGMVVAGLLTAVVFWLADRTRRWYIATMVGIFVASVVIAYIYPVAFAPLFNHYETARLPRADDVAALERKAELPGIPIRVYNRSRRTQTVSTGAVGFGATRAIVLSDTSITAGTPEETAFFIASALGHIKYGDPLRIVLIEAVIVVIGVACAVLIADRIGFRRDDDPLARLALVGALLGVMYLFAVPLDNVVHRAFEWQADAYAVALTHDPASAIRALIRRADQQVESPCPALFTKLYVQRTPAIGSLVEMYNGLPSHCP